MLFFINYFIFITAEQDHCFRCLDHLKDVCDPLTNEPIGDTFSNIEAAILSEKHV